MEKMEWRMKCSLAPEVEGSGIVQWLAPVVRAVCHDV